MQIKVEKAGMGTVYVVVRVVFSGSNMSLRIYS